MVGSASGADPTVTHRVTEGGLRNGKLHRSLSETTELGDVHEIIELFDIHGAGTTTLELSIFLISDSPSSLFHIS